MGGILITQIPVLCGSVMGGTPGVNTFLVTMFALGVGLGYIGAQWVLKGRISARLVPVSAALLSVFLVLLALSVWRLPPAAFGEAPVNLNVFLNNWVYLRLGLCCLLVSVLGGLFVVPLNAFIQHRAERHERSRVIAANNIVNALFICLGSLIVMVMTKLGFSLAHVFFFVALTAVATALLTLYFLPEQSLKNLAALLLKIFYRPKVEGLEHIEGLGDGPALIVANHTSFLDVVFLVAYIPRQLTFAIDAYWAKTWWLKPLLRVFKALPVNPNQPLATRGLIDSLNNGELVVIFPEGRITNTGSLMKVYEGSGLIAAKSKAPIVPVIIDGAQYTRFGRLREKLRNLPKKPISVTVMAPRHLTVPDVLSESQRDHRRRSGEALYRLMLNCLFEVRNKKQSLWEALLEISAQCGPGRLILEDAAREPISYRTLIRRAKVLGRHLAGRSAAGENVGLLLPNSVGSVTALFALWAFGRVPVMLNYTQGPAPLASALATAQIKTIVTSRRFLENLGLEAMVGALPAKLIFVEDLKFSLSDKLNALLSPATPALPDSPAVLVFTYGSEGKP